MKWKMINPRRASLFDPGSGRSNGRWFETPVLQNRARWSTVPSSFPSSSRRIMHTNCARQSNRLGVTFIELLCATGVLSMVVSVTIVRCNLRVAAHQAQCVHNLKEMSLAFRQFANDNADRFPMQVPETLGGARAAANKGDLANVVRPLGDYSLHPEFAVCPADFRRAAASVAAISTAQLSYFVNVDADHESPNSTLLGDRNVVAGKADGAPGQLLTGLRQTAPDGRFLRWSDEMHRDRGNIAFADGSVKHVLSAGLPAVLSPSKGAAARLLFPQ